MIDTALGGVVLRPDAADLGIGLELDAASGLPLTLLLHDGDTEERLPLETTATLVTEGTESLAPPGPLMYDGTVDLHTFHRSEAAIEHLLDGISETFVVTTRAGNWTAVWEYTFRRHRPGLAIRVRLTPRHGRATLRDLRLTVTARPDDLEAWRVEAPGNQIRPGVSADTLVRPVFVSSVGGLKGSSGLVALHEPEKRRVVILWPFNRTEVGTSHIRSESGAFHLETETQMAGRLHAGEWLRYDGLLIDVAESTWNETRDEIATWLPGLGITSPADTADWIENCSIYEVQIGTSVFWNDYRYAPYPTVQDLLDDLGRIQRLGFDVLQIMPRQPYPSYNVHDYFDIDISYGAEGELRRLVDDCHARGLRVILDIVLHGVVDQQAVKRAADGIRSGPFHERLGEATTDPWGSTPAAIEQRDIAWSRHVLDFEPYWSGGASERHPLVDEHSGWFMRDSEQNVVGVYTHAFDVANRSWQEHFSTATEELVRRLDVDGFRFDAPTYNELPNWSTATQGRASYSAMGCLQLFERLRPRLKRLKSSIMFYTEPSGLLFRNTMDLTYNYEEQWLVPAVLGTPIGGESTTTVHHGRDLAAWFRDRNALLPVGARVAHHVDSHDTFWWPLPGQKWRREQYGTAATQALLAVFALSGGVLMTFVGGETDLDEGYRRVHRLRSQLPELAHGDADYDAVGVDHPEVYAVARRAGDACSILLVNLSPRRIQSTCTVDTHRLPFRSTETLVHDMWSDEYVDAERRHDASAQGLVVLRSTLAPYQIRLLALR